MGEVWLCSGQSNMYMPINGYTGQPTTDALKTVAHANNPNLRLFHVVRKGDKQPLEDLPQYRPWQQASPHNVADFSAVAYHFGNQLQAILDVPVGIIHASWGGSIIETWMSTEALHPIKPFNIDTFKFKRAIQYIPTALYNAMIHPLIPFGIKGMLWYQGESNRDAPELYQQLLPAMVNDWRNRWQQGNFPFYYVQIAPYYYKNRGAFESVANTAYLREAQLKALNLIPNSGMAVTLDLGEEGNIHPANKKEVANRLLYHALNGTYNYPSVDCNGPIYQAMEAKDGGIYLEFSNAERGLYAPKGLSNFVIAGADKIFYPAQAKLKSRKKVFVKSAHVPNPVAVRYAWQNWVSASLFDTNMLPASSFRTDSWDEASFSNKQR